MQRLTTRLDLEVVTHLRDAAQELGLSYGYQIDNAQDQTQIADLETQIRDAIQQERERLAAIEEARTASERWLATSACHIGPWAGGYCTICGGRDPQSPDPAIAAAQLAAEQNR